MRPMRKSPFASRVNVTDQFNNEKMSTGTDPPTLAEY